MNKRIIFCADGTWNGPDKDDKDDGTADKTTNVYKLFTGLSGQPAVDSMRAGDEQEKELKEGAASTQIAKYIHGVGDSRNPIKKLMGGAFGAGTIARIVRGYTYISRNYAPGDDVVIVGFSRGAYTARALAGLIGAQGVLGKHIANDADKEKAYRAGAQAWYRYRKTSKRPGLFERLVEVAADLPAFLSRDNLQDTDFVAVDRIRAVAVWDTVGALGVPRYRKEIDSRADAFQFTDSNLSPKVECGLHAVALDEQRIDFTPTLWTQAANVTQVVFPGAHADVGGGYPAAESGLSDISLGWMVGQLTTSGVKFGNPVFNPYKPDFAGIAHKPWRSPPFNVPGKTALRELTGLRAHESVKQRMEAGPVYHDFKEDPRTPYAPTHWKP